MYSLSPLLFLAISVGGAGTPPRADEPRAILHRAIEAGGLDRKLPRHVTYHKIRGKIYLNAIVGVQGALGNDLPLSGEMFVQGNERIKMQMRVEVMGNAITTTVVYAGDKSWQQTGEEAAQDLVPQQTESMERSRYLDRVTDLTPLLSDKRFTLTALGESKVAERPAVGVKVSHAGKPDVSLYFDRGNGLLVKYSYQAREDGSDKAVLLETYLQDYRTPDLLAPALSRLRAAHVETSDAALLAYLRKQTPRAEDVELARRLVRQLADDSFENREKATRGLKELGAAARPFLEEAARSDDPEAVRRARHCLQQVKTAVSPETLSAAIQVLALRKPAGAVEVLLAYVPAADPETAREVRSALAELARTAGKPDAALVRAMEDRDPVRRAAAAAVLGKDGGAWLEEPGRRLYIKLPLHSMKTIAHRDGKLYMEVETLQLHLFNAFEDKIFARPRGR